MEQTKTYEIDRKPASQLLKVSIRTIDRYIRGGRLSARQINGRIWLSKRDILDLKQGSPLVSFPASSSIDTATVQNTEDEIPVVIKRSEVTDTHFDRDFYKDLYNETLKILEDRNQKLEVMQYRIGQLEAQTANAHHTPRYRELDEEDIRSKHRLESSLAENDKMIKNLEETVQKERMNRLVFTWLLYGLLVLQPILWMLLRP